MFAELATSWYLASLEMKTLRGRLIISHILPLVIVVPLVSVLLAYLLETQILLAQITEGLTEEAYLIAESLQSQPEILINRSEAAEFVTESSRIVMERIILINKKGDVLAVGEIGSLVPSTIDPNTTGVQESLAGNENIQVSYGLLVQSIEVYVPVRDVNEQLIGSIGLTATLSGIAEQFNKLRGTIGIIMAVELLLGALIGLLLATNIARPINEVSDAVIDIAHGNRTEQVPVTGTVELQNLSESVNYLSAQLKQAEETRQRLLANLVHEIGRPLGAVLSAIHVLRQEAGEDPEVRKELLAGIDEELKRLQPLLDDLAQIHGQVLGNIELQKQPIELSEWLPPSLLSWRTAALDKGLTWRVEIVKNLPIIEIDPDRMTQVVGNLLSNAIKYTPAGGEVAVASGAETHEVWIEISDTGPGISSEERERVFEPFYRSQRIRRFPQGLGLGLTIARDLVHAHGGRLELVSEPGDGCQFTIYLPYK